MYSVNGSKMLHYFSKTNELDIRITCQNHWYYEGNENLIGKIRTEID
jgi:hypothetical protein